MENSLVWTPTLPGNLSACCNELGSTGTASAALDQDEAVTDNNDESVSPPAPQREAYAQIGNEVFEAEMAARTASREAAFLAPHLRSGMRLLDVGCGPGSITAG